MAGRMVQFPTNGTTTSGYLASPASGKGPGVIVLQEWWGLVQHIKTVCDRFVTAARRSSLRTGCPRFAAPIRFWCSRAARSSNAARTPSCSRTAAVIASSTTSSTTSSRTGSSIRARTSRPNRPRLRCRCLPAQAGGARTDRPDQFSPRNGLTHDAAPVAARPAAKRDGLSAVAQPAAASRVTRLVACARPP